MSANLLVDLANTTVNGNSLVAQTVTGNTNGSAVDMQQSDLPGQAILSCAAAGAGTNPTMNVKIQESVDTTSGNFTDIPGATFAAVTTTDSAQIIKFLRTKRYLRAVATIGGTAGPSFVLSCVVLAQKKMTGSGGGFDLSPSV